MRHAVSRSLILTALLAAAACAPTPPPRHFAGHGQRSGGPPPGGGFRRLFLSPMGEPFRGAPDGGSGVRLWFDGADTDRDGRITLAEFTADADRFFLTLDTNHDGEIDPAEIEHYETVIAPEIAAHGMAGGGRAGGPGGGGGGHRGGHGGGMGGGGPGLGGGGFGGRRGGSSEGGGSPGGAPEGRQGAGRFSFLDIPEPVVSADRDFNRGVSRAEFAKTAGQRFLLLDTAHHGYLTFDTLPPLPERGGRGRGGHRPPPGGGDPTAPDAP